MSERDFDGTSVSGAHIGDKNSKNLAAALAAVTEPVSFTLTLGAEAGNTRRLTLAAKDRAGRTLAESIRVHLRLYSATMIEALAAAATLTEVTGAFVTTDAQASAILDTLADGTATVDIEDVTTALAGDLILLVEPIDREGPSQYLAVTFA